MGNKPTKWCCQLSEFSWSQIAKFMGPTWGPPGSCRPQMGPVLAPWTLLWGKSLWLSYEWVCSGCQWATCLPCQCVCSLPHCKQETQPAGSAGLEEHWEPYKGLHDTGGVILLVIYYKNCVLIYIVWDQVSEMLWAMMPNIGRRIGNWVSFKQLFHYFVKW